MPQLTSPTAGSVLQGDTVTFSWAATDRTYRLHVGQWQGSQEYYSTAQDISATSLTVSGLPTDGSNVWVRLWETQGNWSSQDTMFVSGPSQESTTGGDTTGGGDNSGGGTTGVVSLAEGSTVSISSGIDDAQMSEMLGGIGLTLVIAMTYRIIRQVLR